MQHRHRHWLGRRQPRSPQASLPSDTTQEPLTSKHASASNCHSGTCAALSRNGGSTCQLPATTVPLCRTPRQVSRCCSLQKQHPSPHCSSFSGAITRGNTPSTKGREIPTLSTFQMPCHALCSTHGRKHRLYLPASNLTSAQLRCQARRHIAKFGSSLLLQQFYFAHTRHFTDLPVSLSVCACIHTQVHPHTYTCTDSTAHTCVCTWAAPYPSNSCPCRSSVCH